MQVPSWDSPRPAVLFDACLRGLQGGDSRPHRSAAAHYAPQNIRFNAVAPALVATLMSERARR